MWSDSDDDTTISTSKSKHVIQMYQTISEKTQQKCRQHRTHHTLCHWNHLWQKQIESLFSSVFRVPFQFWGAAEIVKKIRLISKKCTSFKIQPPKKGQFCPANSWAGLPFLFFLKQHTIRRNDRFCMLLFLLLCIRNKSTQNIYK